jgi:hypothetical protein
MGPEGLGRKNFKIETQCNYKSGPRERVPISFFEKVSELAGFKLAKKFLFPSGPFGIG